MKKLLVTFVTIVLMAVLNGCYTQNQETKYIVKGDPNQQDPISGNTTTIDPNWQDIYTKSIKSVPMIERRWCTKYINGTEICNPNGHATGFVVAPGVVATADHVVWDADYVDPNLLPNAVGFPRYFVKYPAQASLLANNFIDQDYEVTGIYEIPERDLALLQVETLDRAPLPLGPTWNEVPMIGEVMAMGHPLDFTFVATLGAISAKLSNIGWIVPWMAQDSHIIKHDAVIDAGNSGGPLLNEWGEVIGVNNAVYEYYTEHFLSVSTEYFGGVNLNNVPFVPRVIPSPLDWVTIVRLSLDSSIDPVDEVEVYDFTLYADCVYRFRTEGIQPTPIDTWFKLLFNGLTYIDWHSFQAGTPTEVVWEPWETGNYSLNVALETAFSSTPGNYHLFVEEYCPAP